MRNVFRYGGKTALIEPAMNLSWTYKELNEECNRLAHAFRASGIKKNDIVMMQLYNSPQFVFGYIASHKTGAIANPINFKATPHRKV